MDKKNSRAERRSALIERPERLISSWKMNDIKTQRSITEIIPKTIDVLDDNGFWREEE